MMDDPHASGHQDEASFMLAAEAAIRQLQEQAETASTAAGVAQEAAGRAEKSAKRWKILTVIMAVIIVLTLALSGLGINLWLNQRAATGQLRQQVVTSCEESNTFRMQQIQVWDHFVGIIEGPNPSTQIKDAADSFEKFVAQVYAAKDCQQAFSPAAGPSPSPSSLGALYAPGVSVIHVAGR